jgi:hypothetical protein
VRRHSQGPFGSVHPGSPQSPERSPDGPTPSSRGPACPTLRANPFPEVTDLFCRIPLPTLSHQLEAVHLGDLMRFCVRPGAKSIPSPRFSRAVEGAPDPTNPSGSACHRTLAPDNPISGCAGRQEEKITLPGALADVSQFSYVAVKSLRPGSGILTGFPFDRRGDEAPL